MSDATARTEPVARMEERPKGHTPLPANRVYLSQGLSEPCFGDTPQVFYYVKVADGRRRIVRQEADSGLATILTTDPAPGGGVGYGGGVFTVHGRTLVYAAKGGRLVGVDVKTGAQWNLTPAYEGVAAPIFSPCGRFVAFLSEQDGVCNVLLVDVKGQDLPIKISQNPWYAFNPAFSPDGRYLAWQEWSEHEMPWDESYLRIARLARPTFHAAASYEAYPEEIHTLARPRASFASPQFSPDSRFLAFTSDESGWRSLYVAQPDGRGAVRLETGPGEIGRPGWVPGQIAMRWSTRGDFIYATRRFQSRDYLVRVSWPSQVTQNIPSDWTEIEGLQVREEHLIFIGSTPTRPHTLVTYDTETGLEQPRSTSAVGLIDRSSLSAPKVLSWEIAGGQKIWGVFYRALGPNADSPRPLLVSIHGGPTAERALAWDPQAQYFATRGWHYLHVNHRGSTGFGRAYQDLLRGQWGVFDVQDAKSGAEHLVKLGLADPKRLVITGGSAGGYTTLMALTQDPDFWAAGVSLYGIGDLYELKQGSHRFEVNYEDGLIGPLPEAGPLWKERSPLTHARQVRAPVLLFHGKEDKAVPYAQSVAFAEAVRRQGVVAELVLYDDEGHGFSKERTRRDVLERIERFLDKYVICQQS